MNIIKNTTVVLLLGFFVIPLYVGATSLDTDYTSGLTIAQYNDKKGTRTVHSIVRQIILFFLTFLATISVLVIVVAGIMYITSGGDEGKVKKAKNWIMYAIIPFLINYTTIT